MGEGLHGALGQVRAVDPVGVDGLGHRIGDDFSPEHLAVRDAHIPPQLPGLRGNGGDLVVGGDHLQQPLVDDAGGQGEDQEPGIELGESRLKPAVPPLNGRQHPVILAQRLLNGGLQILDQHCGGAHVHLPERGVPLPAQEALPGQQVLQIGLRRRAVGPVQAVDAVIAEGAGQHLGHQQLEAVPQGIAGVRRRGGDEQSGPRGAQADPVSQAGVPQGAEQLGGRQIAVAHIAQQRPALAATQEQDAVPAMEDAGADGLPVRPAGGQVGHQLLLRLVHPLEGEGPRVQQRLVLAVPEVQPVLIDEVLDHRVDEVGNVPVQVHILPDAGGADVLQVGRQLKLDHPAGDPQLLLGRQGGLPRPAEYDVVHGVDGPGPRLHLVGGGMGHYVAAHHQIDLLVGEELPQALQVGGIGDIHWDVVGKQVDMEVPRHRQADDLPADQVGLGLLGPGELVHRQIDLKAQIPDGVDDPLMGQREGVEGAGEEGHPPGTGEGEGAVVHPPQGDEPVDVGQGGGPVKKGEPVVLHRGLVDQEEELAVAQGKQPGFLLHGEDGTLIQQLARHQQRLLPHRGAVVGQSLKQQAQQFLTAAFKGGAGLGKALPVGGVVLKQHPDGVQRAGHRRVVGGAQQIFQPQHLLVQFTRIEVQGGLP